MTEARTQDHSPPGSDPIALSSGAIRIRDGALFGAGRDDPCRRFLARAFEVAEVRSVTVDRAAGIATIRHEVDDSGLPGLLGRLATALRPETTPRLVGWLPAFPGGPTFSVRRHGALLTTWEVLVDEPGWLRLRHEALRGDEVLAHRIEREFHGLPGIGVVKASGRTGHLLIRHDPGVFSTPRLLGLLEGLLRRLERRAWEGPAARPMKFGVVNLNLGIAAAGEFLVPALLPVSAVLLVGTNVRTFREARLLLARKRLGLPVLYLAIVATTLATGQFLASALMTWFFRFWHRRFRVELASEQGRLLDEPHEDAGRARLLTHAGVEVLVKVDQIRAGDRLIVDAGESVPADGRVIDGEGVVDERGVRGLEGISRKRPGDGVLAGSTILAGSFRVEVARVGEQTRAASIRRALLAATSPAPGPSAPTIRSETFASKAVGPTLATAGVGLLAGDLLTVGAILRPDYATGPGMAVPLETLHNVARCARVGVVARDPLALERLAEVDLFVLQDHPTLERAELDVARIETRMPEAILLRYAASTFRHLVDDRSTALLGACRGRRIHLLNLEPIEFGRGVLVSHDKHPIRVFDADPAAGPAGPLAVEVDGSIVGLVGFGPTARLEAASAIDRIRRASHVPFALVSPRGEAEVAGLARSLGVEMYRGDFSSGDTASFLDACRGRGLKTAYVGDCRANPRAASAAHVAISLDPGGVADLDADPAGLLMQQARLAALADLHAIARTHATRVIEAQQFILVPNLLCVAGAFFFGFTGLTAVMLSNLGTLGLYRRVSDSLRGLDTLVPLGTGQPRRAG